MKYILIVLIAINLITLLLYGADKAKAKKKKWRIPEAVLLTAAFLGGFAEMTGGLGDAAALYRTGRIGIVTAWGLSGAIIGYGGFCVDMQIATAAAEAGVPMRQYRRHRLMLAAAGALAATAAGTVMGIG